MKGPMKFNDNNFRVSETGVESSALTANPLQKQATELLMDPGASNLIMQARFKPDEIAGANVSQDQVSQALHQKAAPELFDKLAAQDSRAAADYAVAHTEMQTHALHGTDDVALREQVRVRLTGAPEMSA